MGYFYGVSTNGLYECGAIIFMSPIMAYHFYYSGDFDTNTRAEALALWGALRCASWIALKDIMVARDSNIVIDWANGKDSLQVPSLLHWFEQSDLLKA